MTETDINPEDHSIQEAPVREITPQQARALLLECRFFGAIATSHRGHKALSMPVFALALVMNDTGTSPEDAPKRFGPIPCELVSDDGISRIIIHLAALE